MLHPSAEALAWTVTLVLALAILGLIAVTTWRWHQRPSASALVGRDMRKGPPSTSTAQILASDIGNGPMLQNPVSQSRSLRTMSICIRRSVLKQLNANWAVFLMRATFSTLSAIFGFYPVGDIRRSRRFSMGDRDVAFTLATRLSGERTVDRSGARSRGSAGQTEGPAHFELRLQYLLSFYRNRPGPPWLAMLN